MSDPRPPGGPPASGTEWLGDLLPEAPTKVPDAEPQPEPQVKANGAHPAEAEPVPVAAAGPSVQRLAPADIDAERSTLGSILIDRDALPRVMAILTPRAFYEQRHATIYAACLTLAADGSPIDLVTLSAHLRKTQQLDAVGGPGYLTGLMNSVPTAVHAEHYAQIVAARALAREAIAAAGRIAAAGYEDATNPDELVLRIRTITETVIGTWRPEREALPEPVALDALPEPADPNTWLIGNLIRPGTTVMLAGPPGVAKSWASRQLALAAGAGLPWFLDRYAIERPLRVLVIDEDNGPDEEWRRDEALLAHLELTRTDVNSVWRSSLAGVQLEAERWQHWLRDLIERLALDLLVLDPISEMHGGKELREDPAFRSMLGFLKRLKVECPRMATLLVHHTRKLPASERAAHRGLEDVRGQWGQTPDVVITLSPLGDRRVKWETHKRVAASSLILEQVAQGQPGEGGLHLVADEAIARTQAMANDARVIDAVRDGFTTFADIQAALGMPKGTLSGVLQRLVRAGVVMRSGQVYSVSEDD